MKSGFAYKNEYPLCFLNEDGSVNHEETKKLIRETSDRFAVDVLYGGEIPASERENVLNQITGAAASHGIPV